MELNVAIELLKKAVKPSGTIDQKHIDLTLIPADKREEYEKALMIAGQAIKEGHLSRDEFNRRVNLE